MKRNERHHLKENELADDARQRATAIRREPEPADTHSADRRRRWRRRWRHRVVAAERPTSRAEQLLADAMVALNARVVPADASRRSRAKCPAAAQFGATGTFSTEAAKLNAALPKLKAAADAYPDSDAGITARYHLAGVAGRARQARRGDRGRSTTSCSRAGVTASTAGWRCSARPTRRRAPVSSTRRSRRGRRWRAETRRLPMDAILMELAKAYLAKGNTEEARKSFTQIVDEHPTSPYTAEARAELGASRNRLRRPEVSKSGPCVRFQRTSLSA